MAWPFDNLPGYTGQLPPTGGYVPEMPMQVPSLPPAPNTGMPTPYQPQTQAPSMPNSGGLSNGGFNTGYPGPYQNQGGFSGNLFGGMGQPQFPWQGYQQAWDQSQRAAGMGDQALMGGMTVGSPFGMQVGNRFTTPQGMDPRAMQMQQNRIAETGAGSRENTLMRMRQQAQQSGFGADSAAYQQGEANVRANSARDVTDAQNQLAIADMQQKYQEAMQMAQIMAQLYQTDAGLRGQYASNQYSRQFPIMPGQGQMGQQPGMGQPQGQGQWQTGPLGYGMWVPPGQQNQPPAGTGTMWNGQRGPNTGALNPGWY